MGFIYGKRRVDHTLWKSFADDAQVWLQYFSMVQDQPAS
jgi:hypothetical protein